MGNFEGGIIFKSIMLQRTLNAQDRIKKTLEETKRLADAQEKSNKLAEESLRMARERAEEDDYYYRDDEDDWSNQDYESSSRPHCTSPKEPIFSHPIQEPVKRCLFVRILIALGKMVFVLLAAAVFIEILVGFAGVTLVMYEKSPMLAVILFGWFWYKIIKILIVSFCQAIRNAVRIRIQNHKEAREAKLMDFMAATVPPPPIPEEPVQQELFKPETFLKTTPFTEEPDMVFFRKAWKYGINILAVIGLGMVMISIYRAVHGNY